MSLQGPPAHPQTWSRPEDINVDLIDKLRLPAYAKGGCSASAAIGSAARVLPPAATAGVSGGKSSAFAGVSGVLNDVTTHFSEVLRQMPQPVQRLVGDISAPKMLRRLQAASTRRQHQELPPNQPQLQHSGDSPWHHHVREGQTPASEGVFPDSGGADATARQGLEQSFGWRGRQLAQAWQGESWLLDDPFSEDDDGPDAPKLVRQYAALGHACPLFARKVTQLAAARFADVATQHIFSP